jgi:2-phosphosulfolactate phosphatase
MDLSIETLLSPAEYQARRACGFAGAVCVVFDVLRATSVMVTGLANGARSFLPVEEIAEALAYGNRFPDVLLAGERDGLRITSAVSGGREFDFGNSPREYVRSRVGQREIVTTTTNGTRALRACVTAEAVALGSFLNLAATVRWLQARPEQRLVLVCAGTQEQHGIEDILCAGALVEMLGRFGGPFGMSDATRLALLAYQGAAGNLGKAIGQGRNGSRLLANPDFREDVEFCLQRDVFDLVAVLDREGKFRRAD